MDETVIDARAARPATPPRIPPSREAVRVWARIAALVLRRPRRADRGHAPHPGRGEALDRRERGSCTRSTTACCCPAPRRSSSRSISAGCCTGPAAASSPATLFVLPGFLAIMALSLIYAAFGSVGIVAGAVLRPEGRGARHRARGGHAHRRAGAEEQRDGRASPPPRSSRSSSSACRSR